MKQTIDNVLRYLSIAKSVTQYSMILLIPVYVISSVFIGSLSTVGLLAVTGQITPTTVDNAEELKNIFSILSGVFLWLSIYYLIAFMTWVCLAVACDMLTRHIRKRDENDKA